MMNNIQIPIMIPYNLASKGRTGQWQYMVLAKSTQVILRIFILNWYKRYDIPWSKLGKGGAFSRNPENN